MHAQGVEGRHRPSGGGAKADDHRAQPTPVVPGGSGDLHGVEHRAVAGKLIVLVEHVQVERAVAVPVVHRLKGDQGELVVDGDLGELPVLHAGPPPEDLPEALGVAEHRLGLQDDVALATSCSRVRTPATQPLSWSSATPKRSS